VVNVGDNAEISDIVVLRHMRGAVVVLSF
jgi:hypothetical protein